MPSAESTHLPVPPSALKVSRHTNIPVLEQMGDCPAHPNSRRQREPPSEGTAEANLVCEISRRARSRLTTRISDPAPLTRGLEPRRCREGMRFVNGAP